MKILPISNNNMNLQKKQKSPTFQARINPNILAQLKGKKEPLEKIIVKSAVGVLSVPSATAAAYFLNNDADENRSGLIADLNTEIAEFNNVESLKNITHEDLYSILTKQDKDGNTILHQGFDRDTLNFLRENLDEDEFVTALSIENAAGFPSADSYDDDFEDAITSPDFDSLSLEKTIKLLININANENVIDFLRARLEKEQILGKPVSAAINRDLFCNIYNGKSCYSVETKISTFPDVENDTISELFEIDEDDKDYLVLDKSYLPMATPRSLSNLMESALKTSTNLEFEEFYDAIDAIEDNDQKSDVLESALSDNLKLLEGEHLEYIYRQSAPEVYKKVFKIADEDGNTIFHLKGFNPNRPNVEGIWKNLRQFGTSDFIADVMLTKDATGNTPLHKENGLTEEVIKYCKEFDPMIVKRMLIQKNNNGFAVIQCCHTAKLLSTVFNIFNGREDDLADILLAAVNHITPLRCYLKYEADMFESKILELATDSDLSLEKSIELLEASEIEPQILEYLKLQQQILNNQ